MTTTMAICIPTSSTLITPMLISTTTVIIIIRIAIIAIIITMIASRSSSRTAASAWRAWRWRWLMGAPCASPGRTRCSGVPVKRSSERGVVKNPLSDWNNREILWERNNRRNNKGGGGGGCLLVVCWGWLVALCKPVQNSDSEFSDRRLTLRVSLWVSPEKEHHKKKKERTRCSGISRMRLIHSSNRILFSTTDLGAQGFQGCCAVFSCLATLRIEKCLNSTLWQYSWNPLRYQY